MSTARVCTLALALAAVLPLACGGPDEQPLHEMNVRSSRAPKLWTVGAVQDVGGTWYSDVYSGLSDWQEVECLADGWDPGGQSAHLLNTLTAWREKSSNLDNFVARLRVGCTNYVANDTTREMEASGSTTNHLVYSGGYRDTSGSSTVDSKKIPIGIRLALNSGGAYVKDMAMLQGTTGVSWVTGKGIIYGYSSPSSAGWALNYASYSKTFDVMCPDQSAVTDVQVRNDTSTGKLREISILCLDLADK